MNMRLPGESADEVLLLLGRGGGGGLPLLPSPLPSKLAENLGFRLFF